MKMRTTGFFRLVAAFASAGAFAGAGALGASQVSAAEAPRVYKACPHDKTWSDAANGCVCAAGLQWDSSMRVCTAGPVCPAGTVHDKAKPEVCIVVDPSVASGKVAPNPSAPAGAASSSSSSPKCPPNKQWSDALNMCAIACPPGKAPDAKGATCILLPPEPKVAAAPPAPGPPPPPPADANVCPVGKEWRADLEACMPTCPTGRVLDADKGTCIPSAAKAKNCPAGKEYKPAFDGCVPICPADQVLDFKGVACHPIRIQRRR